MTENEAISRIKDHMEIHRLKEPRAIYITVALSMAITALKEIQQYREMDKKLREAYGDCDGLLAIAVEGLCKHSGINIGEPIKARLLTDEDVDKWDAYREIGTVEECREAVEKQKPKKIIIESYCPTECPTCGHELSTSLGDGYYKYPTFLKRCPNCGQAIQW